MQTTTQPASRFGWEGQTLEYTVTVDGATQLVAPAKDTDGVTVRILDTRPTSDGIEARVAVDVTSPVFY